jgi:hypothetical protein
VLGIIRAELIGGSCTFTVFISDLKSDKLTWLAENCEINNVFH